MAAKNSIKTYVQNSFYHIYNRGVEKRNIFQDSQDFSVFCSYLKNYLLPKNEIELKSIISSTDNPSKEKQKAIKLLQLKNFSEKVELHAFALLPNHFHLLIRQEAENDIDSFMNAVGTRYASYFNRRNKRVGPLYQGVYKAVLVKTDEQLLHLSRYIHLNPLRYLNLPFAKWREIETPFSLPNYLQFQQAAWIKTDYILRYFRKNSPQEDYQKFLSLPADESLVSKIVIEEDN